MVRSQWEPFAAAVDGARPARAAHDPHARAHRPRRRHEGVPARRGLRHRSRRATRSTTRCRSTRTRRSCPRSTRSSTTSPSSARVRSRTSSTAPRSSRRASRCSPPTGHTAGDLIVLVADADVCFAGDLCFFGVTPLAFQGDPAVWADMLDAVVELADVIVPGHGPVGGEAEVRELQGYLRACVAAQGDVGRDPARARGTRGSSASATPSTSSAPRCSPGATTCIPPSMLKAIGLLTTRSARRRHPRELMCAGVRRMRGDALVFTVFRRCAWRRTPIRTLKLTSTQGRDAHARRLVDDVPPRAS